MAHQHILVAYDGTSEGDAALLAASKLATHDGARLTIVSVVALERTMRRVTRLPMLTSVWNDVLLDRVTEETRGTLSWGRFNVQLAADMLAHHAGQTDALAEEEIPSHIPGKRAKAVRQPVGVVVGTAPWNAPVILGVRAVAAPLAYGNTVVLKASEQCPRTPAAIVDALKDAGVPA